MTRHPQDDDLPDWPARLARLTADILARRQRTAALRAQLAEARAAGKRARHARRLAAAATQPNRTKERP